MTRRDQMARDLASLRLEHEEWICNRLIAWLRSSPRKQANMAFTDGPLRQVAYAVEDALRGQ